MLCIYCERNEAIENSHVIPKQFYDWLKATSVTPFIREINNPNKRLQDGLQVPLLCPTCENNFSKFENNFKTHLFSRIINYRKEIPNVLKITESDKIFYLSLIWRQLAHYLIYDDKSNQYPDEISLIAEKAQELKNWMNNIQDFVKYGGSTPIYIIPVKSDLLTRLGFIPSATGVWYEYERSIGFDIRFWGKSQIDQVIVYIKLPFHIVVCDLKNIHNDWDMPALHSVDELKLSDIMKVSKAVIALSYDRYNVQATKSYMSMSEKQRDKILKDFGKLNDAEIHNTGSYKSMSRHNRSD